MLTASGDYAQLVEPALMNSNFFFFFLLMTPAYVLNIVTWKYSLANLITSSVMSQPG